MSMRPSTMGRSAASGKMPEAREEAANHPGCLRKHNGSTGSTRGCDVKSLANPPDSSGARPILTRAALSRSSPFHEQSGNRCAGDGNSAAVQIRSSPKFTLICWQPGAYRKGTDSGHGGPSVLSSKNIRDSRSLDCWRAGRLLRRAARLRIGRAGDAPARFSPLAVADRRQRGAGCHALRPLPGARRSRAPRRGRSRAWPGRHEGMLEVEGLHTAAEEACVGLPAAGGRDLTTAAELRHADPMMSAPACADHVRPYPVAGTVHARRGRSSQKLLPRGLHWNPPFATIIWRHRTLMQATLRIKRQRRARLDAGAASRRPRRERTVRPWTRRCTGRSSTTSSPAIPS